MQKGTDDMTLPRISIGALGGTIGMTAGPDGTVTPQLDGDDLVAGVPELAALAQLRTHTVTTKPSPSITLADLGSALEWARAEVEGGAQGIVLTHGTDTLEETAFILDLVWGRPQPIVLTGAMRSGSRFSSDGPANLASAVVAAASPDARDAGVLVCMNDEVHLARLVTKADSQALESFQSPGAGPLGYVREGVFRRQWHAQRTAIDAVEGSGSPPEDTWRDRPMVNIPIIEAGLADDGALFRALIDHGVDAVVINGSGVGHTSAPAAEQVRNAVDHGAAIVVASRTHQSGTARKIYGYAGSESDLMSAGAILAGRLSARKARLALRVLQDVGLSIEEMRDVFERHWGGQS